MLLNCNYYFKLPYITSFSVIYNPTNNVNMTSGQINMVGGYYGTTRSAVSEPEISLKFLTRQKGICLHWWDSLLHHHIFKHEYHL